jgi:hypothetical protein
MVDMYRNEMTIIRPQHLKCVRETRSFYQASKRKNQVLRFAEITDAFKMCEVKLEINLPLFIHTATSAGNHDSRELSNDRAHAEIEFN